MANGNTLSETFGPLAMLIGQWYGDKGVDISPEKVGEAKSEYFETIAIEPVGDALNAEEQELAVLTYKQIVTRKSDGQVYHHQVGYWYYDKKTQEIFYTLAIPRVVTVLAHGDAKMDADSLIFTVKADASDKNYGVLESIFMAQKASTRGFSLQLSVTGDRMQYKMQTDLNIYNRAFGHTDQNALIRKK